MIRVKFFHYLEDQCKASYYLALESMSLKNADVQNNSIESINHQ